MNAGGGKDAMIVTRIEELSRSRSRIYVDDSFAFVLYKGELHLYGIREGEELNREAFRKITEEVLGQRATRRCMELLKSRPYTEKQLRDKLIQGEYPASCIEKAVAYVKSYGYVDDARYVQAYIISAQEKKSRRAMEADLLRRGVDAELIREAFLRQEEQDEHPIDYEAELEDEEELARRWLKKRRFDVQNADRATIQKTAAFLYRKGIGAETIRKVLSDA